MAIIEDYFYFRQNADHYKESLGAEIGVAINPVHSLVLQAFGSLHAVYFSEDPKALEKTRVYIDEQPGAYISHLSKAFFRDHYEPPQLLRGSDAESGRPVALQEFITLAVRNMHDREHNAISYLVGEMGVGKTTFINYLISEKLKDPVDEGNIWFIRLDFERNLRMNIGDAENVAKALSDKAYRVLTKMLARGCDLGIDQQVLGELADKGQGPYIRLRHLQNLVDTLEARGRHLFLVLDNLDAIVHNHDRALFYARPGKGLPEDAEETLQDVYQTMADNIQKLVNSFTKGDTFGDLASNMLLVMRPDTYHILKQFFRVSRNNDQKLVELTRVFCLKPPDWKRAYDCRLKHLRSFKYGWKNAASTVDRDQLLEVISQHLEDGAPDGLTLGQQLRFLTNGSLRDFMRFLESFGALPLDDQRVASRLGENEFPKSCSLGLLAYMLDSRRLYSQLESGFPNIYLARVLRQSTNPQGYIHPFTYWLKRLLVEFINKRQVVEAEFVIDHFCASNSAGRGYPENLVRECLGSLADATMSNMLRVDRERVNQAQMKIRTGSVRLTPRGKYCLASVFDRFCYLQLVVVDRFLPLPRGVAREFPDPDKHRYSFVVKRDNNIVSTGNYIQSTTDLLSARVCQVTLFLYVLEAALNVERTLFGAPFDRLDALGAIPDITTIQANVKAEIQEVGRAFPKLNWLAEMEIAESRKSDVVKSTENGLRGTFESYSKGGMSY